MSLERGLLLVISGPSGVGKGTVLSGLMADDANLFYSISATTRTPRPGEVDGVNYSFITKEQFEELTSEGQMLEYANYSGNYYGTPKGPVDAMRIQGKDVILEIEVQGALQVKERCSDAVLICIVPPSFAQLEQRLRGRGTESEVDIEKRLEAARRELNLVPQYDYVVTNQTVEQARADLATIIAAEKMRMENNALLVQHLLEEINPPCK